MVLWVVLKLKLDLDKGGAGRGRRCAAKGQSSEQSEFFRGMKINAQAAVGPWAIVWRPLAYTEIPDNYIKGRLIIPDKLI